MHTYVTILCVVDIYNDIKFHHRGAIIEKSYREAGLMVSSMQTTIIYIYLTR